MSETLQEQFMESEGFRLRRMFPWINLFRAFRLAIGLRVLTLGIVASLLISAGDYAISWLPFSPHMREVATEEGEERPSDDLPPRTTWPWQPGFLNDAIVVRGESDGETSLMIIPSEDFPTTATFNVRELTRRPVGVVALATQFGSSVLWPARTVIDPAAAIFSGDLTPSATAVAWCQLIWALIVWSTFGVATARIVVLEFAGRESPSLTGSVKFSVKQLPSAIGSVVLPSVPLVGLFLVCRIAGWIAYSSWLRPVVGFFWFIELLCGLGMAVILMLLAAGWPLMVCTMAVDRGDSFEGFTRAFSYVFGRPWYALWLLLLTTLYGSAVFVFLVTVLSSSTELAEAAAGGHAGVDTITASTPAILGDDSDAEPRPSSRLAGFWLNLWATAIAGFAASFFWSASAIAYLLLRKSVDATPIDEIHDGEAAAASATLPLSGMAAAEQREQQLSAGTPSDETGAASESEA